MRFVIQHGDITHTRRNLAEAKLLLLREMKKEYGVLNVNPNYILARSFRRKWQHFEYVGHVTISWCLKYETEPNS